MSTTIGYTALTRVSLHWSAFESLLKAVRVRDSDVPKLAARYTYADCLKVVRAHDPEGRFFTFVLAHLSGPGAERLREQLTGYLRGGDCPSLPLAKSIRHIFFHGMLTPSAQDSRPQDVDAICTRLSRSLVTIKDREFSERVGQLVDAYP
jgi:hypothetical protein